ncbi:MAG: type VI secretion system ATPase TssH, partial [Bacteroidetes bacterium]
QVLDDGRLTDNKGRVANFKNTIIIMTSNLGSHIIQENFESISENNREEIIEKTKAEVMDLLKKTIRPEFLNRVDEIIMFEPLTKEQVKEIVKLQINQISKRLEEQQMKIELTDYAIEALVDIGFDPQLGARPIKRAIQKHILNQLSKQILAGKVKSNENIVVDYLGEGFVFMNKKEEMQKAN